MTAAATTDTSRRTSLVLGLLDVALQETRRHDRDDLTSRLEAERQKTLHPTCTVLVIGEFNKGKSSLINALLNARVCATDADIATALPTFVRYGETASAVVRGDGVEQRVPVVPAALENQVTARAGAGSMVIEVEIPRDVLRHGMVLVDTPGLGGGLGSAHAGATLRALASADVVVFVTDASQELSAAELGFLRRATDLCPRAVCVLTKIDFYSEWRRIGDIDRGHLRRAGLELELLPLSSPLRQHALRIGDEQLVVESGFPALAAFLRSVDGDSTRNVGASGVAAAHSALSQITAQLATQHAALTDPEGRQRRLAALTAAKQRADELRSSTARWQQLLNDRIGDMASAVDLDIAVRLRGIRKEGAAKLAAVEPGEVWAELEPLLYQRTNEALTDHFLMIRELADAVADDVATRFGESAAELRVEADVSALLARTGASGPETGLAALAVARSSRLELGIAAARGGSAGAIVTHAVGLVAGIALPVTLPITVVLAAVLARKTWKTAKEAQLRSLRAEADHAIAAYLEEVELHARTESRDSVRRVQQHLRDVFSAHAHELHTSAVRNLEVLTRAARDVERGTRSELDALTAELARVRALTDRAGALADRIMATGGTE